MSACASTHNIQFSKETICYEQPDAKNTSSSHVFLHQQITSNQTLVPTPGCCAVSP